jgi:hypothetical protein
VKNGESGWHSENPPRFAPVSAMLAEFLFYVERKTLPRIPTLFVQKTDSRKTQHICALADENGTKSTAQDAI